MQRRNGPDNNGSVYPTGTFFDGKYRPAFNAALVIAVTVALYASSLYSYILFHSLVEITTIAIAFTLFILTWHTRRFLAGGCLKALGIGYGLIALIDLLHTLAYKGMGVFPEYGANLPTQLWIAARSLQAVLLLAAPLFAKRDISERVIFAVSLTAVSTAVAAVFSGAFPDCFIEGKGLTQFKIISEYVISALLFMALFLFTRSRAGFSPGIFLLIVSSIICTIGSELAFTSYISVYGPANMAGHFLKLAAFGLVYRALIVTGFREPFELIFREIKQTEYNLVREKEFGHSLLDSMADGVVACDADGILTLFNRTAREWHGLDPMRLPKEDWASHYDLYRADGVTPLPTTEIPLAMALNGELVKDAGMAIVAKGKASRSVLANGSLITDAEGRKLGAVVVMRDVTALQRLDRELRRTNEELEKRVHERTLELQGANEQLKIELEERSKVESSLKLARFAMDSAADAIVWLAQDGAYFYANRAASDLLGYDAEELLKMKASDINPDHRDTAWQEHWVKLRRHGTLRFEAELIRKDGQRVSVDISANYIEFDGQEYNCAFIRDTSERKHAEESIRQSEQFLNSVIENIPDMIFVKEAEALRFVRFNSAGEKLLGYPRELLLGRNDHDFFPKEEADFFTAKDREVLASKALVDIPEEPIKTRDKGERILHTKKIPIFDKDGRPCYLLGISEDITDRRCAEEEARLNLAQQKALLEVYQKMPEAEMQEIISFVADKCVNLTGSAIGFVGLISSDESHMEAHIWSERAMKNCPLNKPLRFPIREAGLWAEPIRQQKTVIVNDYSEPGPFKKGCPDGHMELLRFMGVPVIDNDRVVAVAGVANKQAPYAESDQYKVSLLLKGMWEIIKRKQAEEQLRGMNEELERRVKERTAELEEKNAELERMNRLFVGRELKMVELKNRITELEKESRMKENGPAS